MKDNYDEFDMVEEQEPAIGFRVVITTSDQLIDGELVLPENTRFRSSTPDSLLFYFLNGGFQFITLKDCEIRDRKNLAFRPDMASVLHIRVAAIVTVQIVNDATDDEERIIQYNSRVSGAEPQRANIVFNSMDLDKSGPFSNKRPRRTT